VQGDAIGLKGGINLYAYASDNPLRWIDPFGKNWADCWANCVETHDYLGVSGALGLTAAGATFPKSWVGLPSTYAGGYSPFTTLPSYADYLMGGGGLLRAIGRIASPLWIGYGDYLFGLELYCAARCAGRDCSS
jgi:hypothetical protein